MPEELPYILLGAVFLAIVGWLVFLTAKYRSVVRKAEIVFKGERSERLSKMINGYFEEIERVSDKNEELEAILKKTKKLAETGLSKATLLRYNPFGDIGSNQSFSLCLLNRKNDGFVISSIHSREGTRVYAKSVSGGESDYNLSEEEKKAIRLTVKK